MIGGCDLDCGESYWNFLPGAVRSEHHWINRSTIDQSVARITKPTIMLGLMDGGKGGVMGYNKGKIDNAEKINSGTKRLV